MGSRVSSAAERDTISRVRQALDSEPRVRHRAHPLHMAFAGGVLTLEGELGDVAAKKLALERAAALPQVAAIVDRIRVEPAVPMGDAEIASHVRDALSQETAFHECAIAVDTGAGPERVRAPGSPRGAIQVCVAGGVVTLDGDVPSLSHKRLAGVLAWWVPGSRDVVNGLGVEPAEEDNDDEISDAVRLVLEKDPYVDADRIRIITHNFVVTLEGLVPTEGERDMAEQDAWWVFGVDRVDNRIDVRPG